MKVSGKKRLRQSAKAKVLALLARREYSLKELETRLLEQQYPADQVQEALQWANAKCFQSQARFGVSLARRRAATYGNRAILAELAQHEVAHNPFEGDCFGSHQSAALSGSPEIQPELQRVVSWLNRVYGGGLQALTSSELAQVLPSSEALLALKAKAYRALAARGFEFSNIEQGWKQFIAPESDN